MVANVDDPDEINDVADITVRASAMTDNAPRLFRVRMSILRPDEGGRSQPLRSGYIGAFWIGVTTENGTRTYNDGKVSFQQETAAPGDVLMATVEPGVPEYWRNVVVGDTIELIEIRTKVATCRVEEVVT
jgi:hypothetical protein